MELGTFAILRFRAQVFQLFLLIALAISGLLIPLYYILGSTVLSMACGLYLGLTALLDQYWRDHTSQLQTIASLFVGATLAMILTGIFLGDPAFNHDPWLLLFPLVAFTLSGPRHGIYWCLTALAAQAIAQVIHAESMQLAHQINLSMAYLTAVTIAYFFTRHNEANLILIGEMSNTDPLTLTHNRRYFQEMLEAEYKRNVRNDDSMTVYMVDIDFFKQYNDRYGHIKGDEVLVQVASALKQTVRRASDLVFRYGGEEFAILSSSLTREQAADLAERLRATVEGLGIKHDQSTLGRISISVGYSHADHLQALSAKTLVEEADTALYRAKEAGRNQVAGYSPAIDGSALHRAA